MLLILLGKILVTDQVASPGGARFPIKQGALQARRAMQPHGELNRFAPGTVERFPASPVWCNVVN
jgi:hypothetical protein